MIGSNPMQIQKKQKKERPTLEQALEPTDGNSKFARALGSVDFHTREKGVQALTKWLSSRSEVSEDDLLKLWKGIFFCFWHSDRAPVQEELADRLAGVLTSLSPEVAFQYFKVFLKTMRRDWFGIDRLRLDKFMMLVRKFYVHMLYFFQQQEWDAVVMQQFGECIQEEVLLKKDTTPAAGLSYHLADVVVPALREAAGTAPALALAAVLEPFCQTLAQTEHAVLQVRLRSSIFSALEEEADRPDEENPLLHLDAATLSRYLFELGAMADVRPKNRAALYEQSTQLERAVRRRQRRLNKANPGAAAAAAAAMFPALPDAEMTDADAAPGGAAHNPLSGEGEAAAAVAGAALDMDVDSVPGAGSGVAAAAGKAGKKGKKKRKHEESPVAAKAAVGVSENGGLPEVAEGEGSDAEGSEGPAEGGPEPGEGAGEGLGPAEKKRRKREQKKLRKQLEAMAALEGRAAEMEEAGAGAEGKAKRRKGSPGSKGGVVAELEALAERLEKRVRKVQAKSGAEAGTPPSGAPAPASGSSPGDGLSSADASVSVAAANGVSANGVAAGVGANGAGPSNSTPLEKPQKKKVHWGKTNLFFEAGGPIPDPDVRTPPSAKPKGSALKKVSQVTSSLSRKKNKSAAWQKQNQNPRPKAADFFGAKY